MQKSESPRLAMLLTAMGEMYGKEISPALAEMYFSDLSEFSIEAIEAAMTAHRKDSDRGRFFPKVADLIDKLELKRVAYETSKHPALVAERNAQNALRLVRSKGGSDVA